MLELAQESSIRRDAALRTAEATITRAGTSKAVLEEVVNDCLYHAERRARSVPWTERKSQIFESARKALRIRELPALEAATTALCLHYAEEIGGHFDPRVYALASRLMPRLLSMVLSTTSPARLLLEGFRTEKLKDRLVISGEQLTIGACSLVYYYHNRLTGYGLDRQPFLVPRAKKGNRK